MSAQRLCPVCKRPIQAAGDAAAFRPFCSKRCADVDLGRWLSGGYAIPAVETEDESEGETGAAEPENPAGNWPQGAGGGKPVRH